MGFRVDIAGLKLETNNFSVDEASTPLAAGDSSGGVGSFSLEVPVPDPYVPGGRSNTPWARVRDFGPQTLIGEPVRLYDTRKGFTLGEISDASLSYDGSMISFSGTSRLGSLNVYGVQAQPFSGTLSQAFSYYLSLGEITTDLFVDDSIASRPVVFPGWNGELWFHLKQMAAAQDCDVSLVSGVILLRPVRSRIATNDRDTSRGVEYRNDSLAQCVEVYQYNNRVIEDELVYPPTGWNPEVEVLNVNAGETQEYTLDLSASVSSIETPEMVTFASQNFDSSSVYTIVADDGLPVTPAQWRDGGGSLQISIDPSTTKLLITLVGATDVFTAQGELASNFSVALGSDSSGNRYSTLRIVGSGVAFNKVKKRVRTGVPASKTGTEVGVTIDNPFISTADDLYRAGTRAAKTFSGPVPYLTGNVISINRRGDSGSALYPTYGQVQTELKSRVGSSATYGQAQDYYASQSVTTYEAIRQFWFTFFQDDNADQVFGNVQGARIYDRGTRRWYRIRTGNLTPSTIGFSADDDLIHEDTQGLFTGLTYQQVLDIRGQFTYEEDRLVGLYA